MKAMVLRALGPVSQGARPLALEDVAEPEPGPGELLVEVSVCGVCHTELDEIEGRTPPPELPVILGHQVVGRVAAVGPPPRAARGDARSEPQASAGRRVGVAWIYAACGACRYCRDGLENLCADFRATGRDADGGYAERMVVPAGFAHVVPDALDDAQAAPLLCAGAIGHRSLRLAGLEDGERLGLTGFGASGHLVLQMVRHRMPRSEVYVFARSPAERRFAEELGAVWTGETRARAPHRLDAIIDTTPAWRPVVEALASLRPGGRLVVNAIRKEDADQDALLDLDWADHLWLEKEVKSVANVARRDVREFLDLAAEMGVAPTVREYALGDANRALGELKAGGGRGAKVLRIAGAPRP